MMCFKVIYNVFSHKNFNKLYIHKIFTTLNIYNKIYFKFKFKKIFIL